MEINLLAFAIPFFISLIIAEYYIGQRRNKKLHNFKETIANLNVGIAERLSDLLTTGGFFFIFSWVYKHFAFFEISPNVITWIALFLATDFLWYWYHRSGHRVNLFWSAHVVHHQSEDFNYSVSARITVFQSIVRGIFWCFLPLIGFPPSMVVSLLLVHAAYSFFTHTQLVGKLGILEYILVTPSHHRVHHSSNPQFLDKNYGDVLIIWDKLFGTFAKEKGDITYGLTSPLKNQNFFWQHFHFISEMYVACKLKRGFLNKLKIIFGKPEDIDPRIRLVLERKIFDATAPVAVSKQVTVNVLIQTSATMLLLFLSILFEQFFTMSQLLLLASLIFLSVISASALLEQRKWVFHLDVLRCVIIALLIHTFYDDFNVELTVALFALLILAFYKTMQRRYYNIVYA